MSVYAKIVGTGYKAPERVVTNAELAPVVNSSDDWIREKIGIRERRYVENGQGASDLGTAAARMALRTAGWQASDVEAVIMASSTPDYAVPGAGVLVQDKLGCRRVPAYDIHNSSPGFLFAMELALALVQSRKYERILVIASEVHSTGLDFSERGRLMTVIFGDGAGAVAVEAVFKPWRRRPLIETLLFSEGKYYDKLGCEAPASRYQPRISHAMIDDGRIYPKMDGRFVFEQATKCMAEASQALLGQTKLTVADIDWVVPHQANLRIIHALAETLGLPKEKLITTIELYGNLSAASIPFALGKAVEDGQIKKGQTLLCPSFGSGLSWGAMVVRL